MKKFFYLSALSLGMMCSITACSDDDTTTIDAKNLTIRQRMQVVGEITCE